MTKEDRAVEEALRGLRASAVGILGGKFATTTQLRMMAQTTLSTVEDTLGLSAFQASGHTICLDRPQSLRRANWPDSPLGDTFSGTSCRRTI